MMLKNDQVIVVMTFNETSKGLEKRHFDAVGADDIPFMIIGM